MTEWQTVIRVPEDAVSHGDDWGFMHDLNERIRGPDLRVVFDMSGHYELQLNLTDD